jgi:hypothetical protein
MRAPILMLIACASLGAQELTPKSLPAPVWTSADGLSQAEVVRELSDGRLIVIEFKENRLVLLSPTGTTLGDIGRVGAGPGEFRQPVKLIPLPNDTTLVADAALRRFLVLVGGNPVNTVMFPTELQGVMNTRAADAAGRFIFDSKWFSTRSDGAAEMSEVMAWDRRTNRVDTLARVLVQGKITRQMTLGGGRASTVYTAARFTPLDEWALLSTGELAILHSEPYSMDVYVNGALRTKGAAIRYDRVKVEDKERPAAIAQQLPEFKTAFGNNGNAMADRNGGLWMLRSLQLSGTTRTYDRFDRSGKRVDSFTMERAILIIGFGKDAVYTRRVDADGLQWIEKRPLPR